MAYKYRITLAGLKGFFRVYLVDGGNSLYTFHKQMRSDMGLPMDQPILFKALDGDGGVVARYALIDIGFGTVDNISVESTVKAGVRSFVYFYDVPGKKSLIVTLEEVTDDKVVLPVLTESKGPDPIEFENGYVAFEDMPQEKRNVRGGAVSDDEEDPDDDDDEDEDDGDEDDDEEIIYDEDE